jgi:multicomponent Na+:H+ antiporter subunit E
MNPIAWNVMLALAWVAITGSFTAVNFGLGMAIGFVALMVSQRIPGVPRYTRRSWKVLTLSAFTAKEIVMANVRVTRDLFGVKRTRPAIVRVPIRATTDAEVTLLAALVTLTPGSTAIDVAPDGTSMLVHVTNLPAGGVEEAIRSVQDGFERRILEVLR